MNILKNFATINTNLLFRSGNSVATINAPKSIFARATVKETFPKEVAIYDLNSLLQLLTFADDQEIEFGEKSLTVTNEVGRFEYFYWEPSLIIAAPTKNIEVDEVFKKASKGKGGKSRCKQGHMASALHGKVRGGKQCATAKGENHCIGMQRTQTPEVEIRPEVKIRPNKLGSDDDTDQHAHNAPDNGHDGKLPHHLVIVR